MSPDTGVPFAALIHRDSPDVGAYSGTSVVWFPVTDAPCLLSFVVGTNGISPDDEILGRPGHARKVRAICRWLNRKHGHGKRIAWAKQDPVRIEQPIPKEVQAEFPEYTAVFDRYGRELYAIFSPGEDEDATRDALGAFLDLLFLERGFETVSSSRPDAESKQAQWFQHLLPEILETEVVDLLKHRRYVVLQGPPGTGKTRMARHILQNGYNGNGTTIQFHPNMTYENFVGGLAPVRSDESIGLRFEPAAGFLLRAAQAAAANDAPYLLHIDEINRADLAKILGEAIYLLEPDDLESRTLELPYDFGPPFHTTLQLPRNLHIIGTMNTADRSLAVVDVAVRRRFAFANIWPQMSVVDQLGGETMKEAFKRLLSIFVDHANEDAFHLVPGHSYFLDLDELTTRQRLRVTLVPLLEEYLAQGYVGGFAEPIRAYLQWLESL